jgi:hypothetical protein
MMDEVVGLVVQRWGRGREEFVLGVDYFQLWFVETFLLTAVVVVIFLHEIIDVALIK